MFGMRRPADASKPSTIFARCSPDRRCALRKLTHGPWAIPSRRLPRRTPTVGIRLTPKSGAQRFNPGARAQKVEHAKLPCALTHGAAPARACRRGGCWDRLETGRERETRSAPQNRVRAQQKCSERARDMWSHYRKKKSVPKHAHACWKTTVGEYSKTESDAWRSTRRVQPNKIAWKHTRSLPERGSSR